MCCNSVSSLASSPGARPVCSSHSRLFSPEILKEIPRTFISGHLFYSLVVVNSLFLRRFDGVHFNLQMGGKYRVLLFILQYYNHERGLPRPTSDLGVRYIKRKRWPQ